MQGKIFLLQKFGTNIANLTDKDDIIDNPSKSNGQIVKPMELRAGSEELHWRAYLSVGFERNSGLKVFVNEIYNVRQSTVLKGQSPAYD